MASALIVAVINTARVFGLIDDPADENAQLAVTQKEAQQRGDEDPESLTKLLQSHTMRSYGSLFSNALSRIQTSPRRPAAATGSTNTGDDANDIIIR